MNEIAATKVLESVEHFWPTAPAFLAQELADWRRLLARYSSEVVTQALDLCMETKPRYRPDFPLLAAVCRDIADKKPADSDAQNVRAPVECGSCDAGWVTTDDENSFRPCDHCRPEQYKWWCRHPLRHHVAVVAGQVGPLEKKAHIAELRAKHGSLTVGTRV